MKQFVFARISLLFFVIPFLGTTSCNQTQKEIASFSDQDKEAIRINLSTFMEADPINTPESFFSQFTEDIYFIYNDFDPWIGIEGLHKVDWCHTISAKITADNIEGDGDLAYARGTYMLSLDCKGDTVNSSGVFLSVHQRQADGSWKVKSILEHNK